MTSSAENAFKYKSCPTFYKSLLLKSCTSMEDINSAARHSEGMDCMFIHVSNQACVLAGMIVCWSISLPSFIIFIIMSQQLNVAPLRHPI